MTDPGWVDAPLSVLIRDMDISIDALRLEVPATVHADVALRWATIRRLIDDRGVGKEQP